MFGTNIHEVWMQNVQDFWRLYYFRDFSFTPLVPKKGSYGQRGSKVLVPTPKDVLKAILVGGGIAMQFLRENVKQKSMQIYNLLDTHVTGVRRRHCVLEGMEVIILWYTFLVNWFSKFISNWILCNKMWESYHLLVNMVSWINQTLFPVLLKGNVVGLILSEPENRKKISFYICSLSCKKGHVFKILPHWRKISHWQK